MDCFLLEGPKILYRIALALVSLFLKSMFWKIFRRSNEFAGCFVEIITCSLFCFFIEPHSYNCLCKYSHLFSFICTSRKDSCLKNKIFPFINGSCWTCIEIILFILTFGLCMNTNHLNIVSGNGKTHNRGRGNLVFYLFCWMSWEELHINRIFFGFSSG